MILWSDYGQRASSSTPHHGCGPLNATFATRRYRRKCSGAPVRKRYVRYENFFSDRSGAKSTWRKWTRAGKLVLWDQRDGFNCELRWLWSLNTNEYVRISLKLILFSNIEVPQSKPRNFGLYFSHLPLHNPSKWNYYRRKVKNRYSTVYSLETVSLIMAND